MKTQFERYVEHMDQIFQIISFIWEETNLNVMKKVTPLNKTKEFMFTKMIKSCDFYNIK
jgi:hypothetical protein